MSSMSNETGPRIQPSQKQISWWTQELSELRAASIRARRQYTRSRRGNKRDESKVTQLYEEYRKARAALSQARWRAKFDHGLTPDKPEGHPYRVGPTKTELQEGTSETNGSAPDKPEDNSNQTEVNSSSQVEDNKSEQQTNQTS